MTPHACAGKQTEKIVRRGGDDFFIVQAAQTRDLYRVDCRFHCPTPVFIPRHGVANQLYRIAQEAVNNAVKHGGASEITILLETIEGPKSEVGGPRSDGAIAHRTSQIPHPTSNI